ncbi:MAG: RluA family pseudouridine synthase [Clostridiales bacterium]|nr:RluA family pseudouridine synthase [Clostridiales bacterium]
MKNEHFQPTIVYEDNHVLVVEKPPNMLTQGDSTGDWDLHSYLKQYLKEKYEKPGEAYVGMVHRMDRPVGGLLCFAKTSKAASRLALQLKNQQFNRQYLAVVQGKIQQSGQLEDYLLKDHRNNQVSVVDKDTPNSKKALLSFLPIESIENKTLVNIQLETGRSHQIRVQFSHFGHPLLGDVRYGKDKPGAQIALWGTELSFYHPTKKEKLTFYSKPAGKSWLLLKNTLEDYFFSKGV